MASHWRRFLPKKKLGGVVMSDGMRLSTVRSVADSSNFATQLKSVPTEERSDEASHLRTQLLAQTPRTVQAQIQMDTHKHGYHNREKRLYELIDFNDTFVSLVLATPHEQLKGFADRLQNDMERYCRRLNVDMFSPEQYDAIVRGLSREIAVFRAARYLGFKADMTNRTEDAFGIDMVIEQPQTGKVLNIDCKTPPAFRHRLEDMVHHGRISDDQLVSGDEAGYLTVIHKRNQEAVPVTLLCILPDRLGDIHDFSFDDAKKLGELLEEMFLTVQ